MQGVQVAPALRNDENSTALHGPLSSFKQQQSSSSSMAAGPPAKPGAAMSSARKAFGNLTYSGDASAKLPSASKQQLQQPQPHRRAFGDITNSAVKPRQAAGGGGSSVLKQQPTKLQDKGAASSSNTSSSVLQQQQSAAAATWSDEPERAAGKTWAQLEEERWAQMDADAEASADQVLAGLRRVMVPLPVRCCCCCGRAGAGLEWGGAAGWRRVLTPVAARATDVAAHCRRCRCRRAARRKTWMR